MATANKPRKYDSESIQNLHGLLGLRSNASMYLDGVGEDGVFLCLRELLDNALDEFYGERNESVDIFVLKDGSYIVADSGQGVPQGFKEIPMVVNGKKTVNKMPTMQAVFGEMHTSGKYKKEAYAVSRGTHGIGAKGTNATAEFFKVTTKYKNKWHYMEYRKAELHTPVKTIAAGPKLPNGKTAKLGTVIHFKPDSDVFSAKSFPLEMIHQWAEITAYLNPGFRITLYAGGKSQEWYSENGPIDYVKARWKQLKTAPIEGAEDVVFDYNSELADVVLSFTGQSDFRGFVCGLSNAHGGTHVNSVQKALYSAVSAYAKRGQEFTAADLMDGVIGLVNAQLHKAQFSGQNKSKLSDARMGAEFEATITAELQKWFKKQKPLAERLCQKASSLADLRGKFKASADTIRELKRIKKSGQKTNYSPAAPGSKLEDRELFIVEGDSAAGPARIARYPNQAILPIRGKILNVMRAGKTATESEEVMYILAAMGYQPELEDPLTKLEVGRVIFLADPDPDGPFTGETQIRCRLTHDMTGTDVLEDVKRIADSGQTVLVPVPTGKGIKWAPATAQLVKHSTEIYSFEIGNEKIKTDGSHKFALINCKPYDERVVSELRPGVYMVKACDMKPGDRVWNPSYEGQRKHPQVDKLSGLGYDSVKKAKLQTSKEPVAMYCLTVPGYHYFALPSGAVSSNCHINSLLMALFFRYLPQMFTRGMIYVAETPEFYAGWGKDNLVYGSTVSEVKAQLKKAKAPESTPVKHIKGYGEITAQVLRHIAMNPQTRKIVRITAKDKNGHVEFTKLMSEDVQYRKEMLGIA